MNYNQTRSFNVGIATELDVVSAMLFDELSFWATKTNNEWVYKTYNDIQERYPFLSEYQIRTAYKALEQAGYIERKIKKANKAPTVHFRILKFLSMETKKIKETNNSNYNTSIKKIDKKDHTATLQELHKLAGNDTQLRALTEHERKLNARLKTYTLDELKRSAKNLSQDKFMVDNKRNKLDYLLRSDTNVERYLEERKEIPKWL